MSPRYFSKSEAVLFGWNTLKKNLEFLVCLFVIILAMSGLMGLVMSSFTEEAPNELIIAASVIFGAANVLISMGVIKISLKFCDQDQARFSDLFSAYPVFLKYLAGSILYGLIVLLGLLALIIPGVYLAVKYQFYDYLIVDKKMGPLEALKKSSQLTQGVKWNLLLFWLFLVALNALGLLALGIGLVATIIISWLATAYVYRRLQLQADNEGALPLSGLD